MGLDSFVLYLHSVTLTYISNLFCVFLTLTLTKIDLDLSHALPTMTLTYCIYSFEFVYFSHFYKETHYRICRNQADLSAIQRKRQNKILLHC